MGDYLTPGSCPVLRSVVNTLLIVIPLLVAFSIGTLSYMILRSLDIQRGARAILRAGKQPIPFTEQLVPILRLIIVPARLKIRWATKEVQIRLLHAGLPWTIEDYIGLRWMVLWLAIISGMGFGFWRDWDIVGQFLVVLVVVTGWIGPDIWLTWQVERRQIDVDLALPNLLDRFALSLEAGTSFDLALKRIVVNFPGLLGADLRRMVRQLDRGYPRAEALDELAERNPSQDLRAFIAAVKQADRLGTSLVRALRVQTELHRSLRRRRAEEASRRLPILIIFPLVFFFLPALLIVYLAPPILHLFLGF